MLAVFGWLLLGALAIGGWILYNRATAPSETDVRTGNQMANPQGRPYSAAVVDYRVNHGLPQPGQSDERPARDVIGWWGIAAGILPNGAHEMRGDYDIDIGGMNHNEITVQVGERGVRFGEPGGGFWRPAFGVLRAKLERKMIDEVNSGFPANPPNPADQSTRSKRMDVRQRMWIQAGIEEGLPTDFGFADWRWAVQNRGARSRGDALRTRLAVLRAEAAGRMPSVGGATGTGGRRVTVR